MAATNLVNESASLKAITDLERSQYEFFHAGKTKDCEFRIEQLRKLHHALILHTDEIYEALYRDLGKSRREAYITEISTINSEIQYFIKNLNKLTKLKKVPTPIFLKPAKSYIYFEPLGRVLIISPWNFPFLLSLIPLIGAIAGGNCVVLKPSEYSSHSAKMLETIIKECFPPEYITPFLGDAVISQSLIVHHWDHVFFTGSPQVGKIVALACAEHLNPMTLELGGKSPVVVSKNANLALAARRIIYGKGINAGQTCVAPDYVLAHADIRDELIKQLKAQIVQQYGPNPEENREYGRIVSTHHFDRLMDLLKGCKVLYGGKHDRATRFIELTLLDKPDAAARVSSEEIFGPLLPIHTYSDYSQMVQSIRAKPKALAAYIFSEDEQEISNFIHDVSFGGGCVNDTIVHPSNTNLKFGGIGASGIGSYHAYQSFRTFTHAKPLVRSSTAIDISIRYLPAGNWKDRMLKLVK